MRQARGIAVAAALAFIALAPVADAAVGDLAFAGCERAFIFAPPPQCVDGAEAALTAPSDIAIARNGVDAYVASYNGIAQYTRAPDGSLTLRRCYNYDVGADNPPCERVSNVPNDSDALAISPDSRFVYLANHNKIAWFQRGSDGAITPAGCIGTDSPGLGTLQCTGAAPDTSRLVISPDGLDLYALSTNDHRIDVFRRQPDGSLQPTGCISNYGDGGCADVAQDPMDDPADIAISPRGDSVYVASRETAEDDRGSVAHFRRGENGGLTFAGCIGSNPPPGGCFAVPTLADASAIAVSPDGANVYVGAEGNLGVLTVLTRNPANGDVYYRSCVDRRLSGECTREPKLVTAGPTAVVVTPDGRNVLLTAHTSEEGGRDVLASFARGTGGDVALSSCFQAQQPEPLDSCPQVPYDSFTGPDRLALSPAGDSVYVTVPTTQAIVRFAREVPPPSFPRVLVPRAADPRPSITGVSLSPRRFAPAGRRTRKGKRSRGALLRYRLSEAVLASVTIERATRGRRSRGRCVKPTRKLRRARKCTRYTRSGRLTAPGSAGANRLRISGKLRGRALKAGRYRLVIAAVDAARQSATPVRRKFEVTRR